MATELKLDFFAKFEGIAETDDFDREKYPHLRSPIIYSDEQRIMQVLLGLQSNALKFTRSGMVSIHVNIL